MIDLSSLTKTYGNTKAVDHITFKVQPGFVTGFLGPNGAGKSTTMRLLVGLDRPTAGWSTINGKSYAEHRAPLREVGVLLDARSIHPGRSARNHLRSLARTHNIPDRRVIEVLGLAGLDGVAGSRAGTFSLGMGQRLGIAAALLGDPEVLILDEPINGMDPDGVVWIRSLLRSFAAEGRTVLLSSHLMSEMALTADRLVVLGRGRVLADDSTEAILARSHGMPTVRVRTREAQLLQDCLRRAGGTTTRVDAETVTVTGLHVERVAELASVEGAVLYEITTSQPSLEEAFFALTADAADYRGSATTATHLRSRS